MVVYRLCKQKYKQDLSGKGAELFGGRWNPVGLAALYTSENISLCILETLVQSPRILVPKDLVLLSIMIPSRYEKELVKITKQQLKKGWDSLDQNSITGQLGKSYFLEKEKLGIIVPSAVVQQEKNIVLNTNHPKFKYVKIKSTTKYNFDQRLIV